jgi:cytochrome c biogenesis protein CcdA
MTRPYLTFAITLVASLVAMLVISLEQVRSIDHFYLNASNFYISLTGVAAMGLIMFVSMRQMFKDARKNITTIAALTVLLVGGFVLARTETFVNDRLFLESMIPHHSRALLVCEESALTDPEIVDLCGTIVESQTREIEQMEKILERL